MKEICNIKECTGCQACYNICPKKCITYQVDKNGCTIASIDNDKCINCGSCISVCPNNNSMIFNTPIKTYAVITKDEKDYFTTASGGAVTVFAKYILSNDGVVYGAAIDKKTYVKHIRVDCFEKLEMLKNSKYVQSDIGNSYSEVKSDLNANKEVLFIGTPCQVAGLKSYLKKDYDKLYIVDIVCHGVPPYKYLDDHIKLIFNRKYDEIVFRNKKDYCFQLKNKGNVVYEKEYYNDLYCIGFLRALFFQESCYTCKYARTERVSDVTAGDFWGFDNSKPFPTDHKFGLSLVLINTQKGNGLFKKTKESFVFQERMLEEAINGNKQLRSPSTRHRNRNRFLYLYKNYCFDVAVKKTVWLDQIFYRFINR